MPKSKNRKDHKKAIQRRYQRKRAKFNAWRKEYEAAMKEAYDKALAEQEARAKQEEE